MDLLLKYIQHELFKNMIIPKKMSILLLSYNNILRTKANVLKDQQIVLTLYECLL